MSIRPLLVSLFLYSGTSVASAQPAAAVARLDSVVQSWLAKDKNTGAVVAVVKGTDTLLFQTYGMADVEAGAKMSADAILGIGSITKQFTAAAILKLRDAGKLSLDDDITKWLPDYDTRGQALPLRRLLDHTSGIPDVSAMAELRPFLRDASLSRDSMYAVIRRYPPQAAPGTKQAYTSTAFWLLHLVVEKASGMSWQRYLESTMFAPLAMTSTGICYGEAKSARRAQGYGVRPGMVRRAPENVPTVYLGSGVLCSSAADMLAWVKALHTGKVLPEGSYREMITATKMPDGTPGKYGYGLEVGKDAHGNAFIGHSGELTGYTSRVNWYPDTGLSIVILINNSGDSSPTAMAAELAAVAARPRLQER
jgi:D-alanyl-D-alanine carboxypeptidase